MRYIVVFFVFFINACSNKMNVEQFENNKPTFSLEDYFNGRTEAWGMFHDRFGNLKKILQG